MKEFSDSEIVDCLRRRESHVVHYLSDKYMPLIRLMIFHNGGSAEDAKDIFQDGLIILLEKIDEGNFVLKCKFKTYLYSVCENLWKTLLDKRRAAANYVSFSSQGAPERDIWEEMDRELHEKIFREAFEQMDQTSRDILKLSWQEMPGQEIAEILGLSYGYVRKRKCEAQDELIEKIKQHSGYIRIMNSEKVASEVVKG